LRAAWHEDVDLSVDDLKELCERVREPDRQRVAATSTGFRASSYGSDRAVFGSWNNERAVRYRKFNNIPGDWAPPSRAIDGFGNLGSDCATASPSARSIDRRKGHLRRVPADAQGEDCCRGHSHAAANQPGGGRKWAQFEGINEADRARFLTLEESFRRCSKSCSRSRAGSKNIPHMQDMEFTIERGRLFMLQTRNGKPRRLQRARAVEMRKKSLIDKRTRLMRVDPLQLDNCSIRDSIRNPPRP